MGKNGEKSKGPAMETKKEQGEKKPAPEIKEAEKLKTEAAQPRGVEKPATEAAPLEKPKTREEELTETIKRVQAEFENYKKRVEREKADAAKFANMDLLAELLTILDDFERAPIAEIKDEKVRKGMEMISGNFRKILEGEGVKPVPADGLLDPHRHEALMWVEKEDLPENTIVSVLQKGYSLNGRILRPARVSVSKKPEKVQDKKGMEELK